MPKFNAYFRYICVYKIDVYYLRLLHLISIRARYCFVPLNDIYETEPLGNASLSVKYDPSKPMKILKMTPQ